MKVEQPVETGTPSVQDDTVADSSSSRALDHINKLPLELLGDIATLLASLEPQTVWTFGSVCRYWRIAALSTPRAWSYLYSHLNLGAFVDDADAVTASNAPNMRLWLERAKSSPLEVSIANFQSILRLMEHQPFPWNRVRSLHLGSVPYDFEKVLSDPHGTLANFDALEALSIDNRSFVGFPAFSYHEPSAAQTNFTRIASTFLSAHLKRCADPPISCLRHLTLYNIDIDFESSAFFPQLSYLQSLKLVNCKVTAPSDLNLMDLIIPERRNLTSLQLDLLPDTPILSKGRASGAGYSDGTRNSHGKQSDALVEFPQLTNLSITTFFGAAFADRHLSNTLDRLSCPVLTDLTVEDALISPKTPFRVNFPKLERLYVKSNPVNGMTKLLDALPNINISVLTLYHTEKPNNSLFLWRMIHEPSLGQGLQSLRFISVNEGISETLLGRLNKSRRKTVMNKLSKIGKKGSPKWKGFIEDENPEPENDFARTVVVSSTSESEKTTPWDTRLWWTSNSLWL